MKRFAVIGTNWITEAFLRAAQEEPDFKLAAVYSRTEERAREFAARHGAERCYTDLSALAESDAVDAVYIASPNAFHADQAIRCMDGGKHVLCEKPIASNAFELRRMIDAARRNDVLLMEAMKSTLLPNYAAVREHLPELGTVRRFTANYCQYSSRYDAYKRGTVLNAFDPAYSNGALMDLGIYCIYPAVLLFGAPDEIKATAVMLDSGVDGEGALLLRYPDKDAVVTYSKITQSVLPSEILGEDGSIVLDAISEPRQVELRPRGGDARRIDREQEEQTMRYEVREFLRLMGEGRRESAINTHQLALTTMEIMDEARRQIGLVYEADRIGARHDADLSG
ncbi:Gfo/Idh/MocA family oxidoreductase [Paenibacillus sp. IB182496]|uniref:Gfo/Idh/MocA family oxidoreductase n=1 Tax=Paenibacillus sabuli TaxID=2772509 RepID=A0A927BRM2_9BACL|nr:Gfo/Idh/MocA family oxidoreductase [Paenibacillus sabuli]MBD2844279.1 Gfo/Idh/MocA family oxidoreductase [Paenibacillus sabuli]